jgi:hypothetical protein
MIKLEDVKQILDNSDADTLTLYLNVDNSVQGNQGANPGWRIWLKDSLRELEASVDDTRCAAWNEVRQRAEAYLDRYQPTSKSVAIFYGANLDQTFELPVNLESHVRFGKPNVTPLLWVIDEFEPYLVALVDQEKARFFTSSLGSIGFEQGIEIDLEQYEFAEQTTHSAMPVRGGGGNGAVRSVAGRDNFEDMVDEHRHRFYKEVVSNLEKLTDKHSIDRIILGGSEESAHAVQNEMPDKLKACVVGILPIPMISNTQDIFEQALPHALEYERQQELALVDQVINFAKAGGRGALGRKDVLDALVMQQVELLVAPWPMDEVLAAELPERVFQSGGNVELVHGEAADRLKAEGGLAARLYYALNKA